MTTNVSESATLSFRIDNAAPPVLTSDIHWYYTGRVPSTDLDFGDFLDITNLTNRTAHSTLTYSEDLLTLEIGNTLNVGGETDAGRYFLRVFNPVGESSSHIDVVILGKFFLSMYAHLNYWGSVAMNSLQSALIHLQMSLLLKICLVHSQSCCIGLQHLMGTQMCWASCCIHVMSTQVVLWCQWPIYLSVRHL